MDLRYSNTTIFDRGLADGYVTRTHLAVPKVKRAVIMLSVAASLALGVIVFPAPAIPSQINTPTTCMLACNPVKFTCSRYPSNQVPLMTIRPRSLPNLYRYVPSGTRCDSLVCVQDPYMCVIGTV